MSNATALRPKPQLILVDGSSYLYRAFHAMPPLSNSKGQATGAIYGVINMLNTLIAEYQPQYLAVIFDAKGKTFRDDLYAKYKANRPPMPDELRSQIAPLHEIIHALGLPCLVIDGVEADDVIGTLTTMASHEKLSTLISTGDKDMAQLVNEHVTLINTMNGAILDPQGVCDKFGIPPEHIIDYLALIGDTSDNIPGVPSVGPKTAVKWFKQYGSLDNIIANAEQIKGKVGEKFRAHLHQLPLSRQLTTIKCDVTLDVTPQELLQQPKNTEKLRELYEHLEFKRWSTELADEENSNGNAAATSSQAAQPATPVDYQTITNEADFETWLAKIQHAELFSFDTETTSLDYMSAEIVGISLAVNANEAAYIPVAHDYVDAPQQLSREYVLEKLRPILEYEKQFKVGQNLKYDMAVLANYDIKLHGIQFDTMLESYVLNSTATRHDMDSLALKYLDRKTIHFEDVAGKGVKQITFNQVPLETAAPYAAEDADITLQLHQTLWPKFSDDDELKQVFNKIELPLVPLLCEIERRGVLIDSEKLTQQSGELSQSMAEIEAQAFEIAGQPFNIGSPKQIQEVLFGKLGLPVTQKTPTGKPSTAESVLQELALDYPLPKLILEYRSMSKLKSTYTDRLPEQINPITGRVHTSYHQAVTATGRLSSSTPNLQNIPIRSKQGRRIRQAFIAPQERSLIAADYSQIELRILSHLSADPGLTAAFAAGMDIHQATAAEIFSIDVDQVTKDQRRSAKAINFGLIYGMSAFGLAKQLGVGRKDAQHYMDRYFTRFPTVEGFMESTREFARQHGYVKTLLGRRLYLPDINNRNAQRRQYAERAAINGPMQGTAADIIKLAMLATDKNLKQQNIDANIIMQVHDELVFETGNEHISTAVEAIRDSMSAACELSVPLIVDIDVGLNWDEAH